MFDNYQIQLQKKIADCLEYDWPEGTLFRVGLWKGDSFVKNEFKTIAEAYDFAEMNGLTAATTDIKKPEAKRFVTLPHIKL